MVVGIELIMRSIIEEGMEIHPPFETPVGLVGLLICFDVSFVFCRDKYRLADDESFDSRKFHCR